MARLTTRARWFTRLLPALAVLALFALAANSPRQPGVGPAAPAFLQDGPCTQFVQSASGDSTYTFGVFSGISQPLLPDVAVAACSLSVQATGWSWLRLSLLDWDPLTLAPDPNTIALRTQVLNPSDLQYYTLNHTPRVNYLPPVVTQSLAGVADPPRTTVAAELQSPPTSFTTSYFEAPYDQTGDAELPVARSIPALGGPRLPLPGAHPVLAHAICDAGGDLQQLNVVQSVSRTDALLSSRPKEMAQRFRVPQRVELRWVELAVIPNDFQSPFWNEPTTVSIHDASAAAPPLTLPAAFTSGLFMEYTDGSFENPARWAGDRGLDHTVVLEPGHDYWLHLNDARAMQYHARVLDGSEAPGFTDGIGGFFTRDTVTAAWVAQPTRALSFKLIGKPVAPVGVVPQPATASFALHVSPNPAANLADVRWSGAVGPVRLEVLDARGRRVASAQGGAAGSWSFARSGPRGQPLPAGVYFVHARDSAGGHAVERLVLVP
ncbi:MAG: T9SS type A sorting domain-containing protein [Candidatus Eisenbacteria bacterium]